MPFMGRDWRAPGETWVRTPHTNGWERSKLRPIQIVSDAIPIPGAVPENEICHTNSSTSLFSLDSGNGSRSESLSEDPISELEDGWIPHCFVKSKSKEFIGCTSISEAFHRLDLTRGVCDVRRFGYIAKVVEILVQEKVQNLSGNARKSLVGILTAIVLRSSEEDVHISTARDLVQQFGQALEGHVCGSPQLASRHQHTANSLLDVISDRQPKTVVSADESSTTFLDLPREILSLVLRRLPDDRSLLETAKAHEALQSIIDRESRLWQSLCEFHFTPSQIDNRKTPEKTWRKTFFELKKYFGIREVYADLIHICCHCKALFWKTLGHPCLRPGSPSVRVTPQQFVDMLIYL
ncbi:hypothetical protein KIN20_021277 [Parelaphostrongylus tenuis]|uniref:F-box domain-containing protein n=1 Tax=Parelaphostrongylus tenuis TaxID=148309 RepID=A0AAD5QUE3_PARTN|nr:hypothetical protein KIN20_021277 [Parelaphostrongylus tenuis]